MRTVIQFGKDFHSEAIFEPLSCIKRLVLISWPCVQSSPRVSQSHFIHKKSEARDGKALRSLLQKL